MSRCQHSRIDDRRGQQRRLLRVQIGSGLAEVRARGRLGSADSVAPLDDVEIELQDALLRELRLESPARSTTRATCEWDSSAGERYRFFASCCVMVLAPRTNSAAFEIDFHRFFELLVVDAVVLPERAVLRDEHRAFEVR